MFDVTKNDVVSKEYESAKNALSAELSFCCVGV
jgi:hypothetical protein